MDFQQQLEAETDEVLRLQEIFASALERALETANPKTDFAYHMALLMVTLSALGAEEGEEVAIRRIREFIDSAERYLNRKLQ
jgi:hypothetical protein